MMDFRKVKPLTIFKRLFSQRKWVIKCLIFLCGLTIGSYLNYYGILFENIQIDLRLNEYTSRLEQSRKLNINGSDHLHIPNIVHFIWFGENKPLLFVNYLSILSAHKVQKPDAIYLHCNSQPLGEWWEKLKNQVPIKMVHKDPPDTIYGQPLLHKYHQGDVARLEILMEYGGIYLDYDVIVVNSFNPLRKYEMTMGKEKAAKLNAGIIIAHKDALFLRVVHQSYRNNYRPLDWDYNSARLPYQLYLSHPEMVHVEQYRLTTPDWKDRHLLWKTAIDWSELFCVHIMIHFDWSEYNPDNIVTMNNTFGEITRYVYYESKRQLK